MKKINISKLVIFTIISNSYFNNNINSMRNNDIQKESDKSITLDALPNEMIYKIIKTIIKSNINKWNDIFNFDNKSLKNEVDNLMTTCRHFYAFGKDIKRIVLKSKNKRMQQLKNIIKKDYSELSESQLNLELNNELNIIRENNFEDKIKIICNLIMAGADINLKNNLGDTALMIACIGNNKNIVKLLINNNANINTQNNLGHTPLMAAAYFNHIKIAKILINNNVDTIMQDNEKLNALLMAITNDNRKIVNMIFNVKGAENLTSLLDTQEEKNNMLIGDKTIELMFHLAWIMFKSFKDTKKLIAKYNPFLK